MFKIEFKNNQWIIEKPENDLDKFTLKFIKILTELKINYVLISGYVAILFGRSRNSEDVDIIIEKLSEHKFKELWEKLYEDNFECIITNDYKEAYEKYLNDKTAIRFSLKKIFLPNMELKFPKVELDEWTLQHKVKVEFNHFNLSVSPIELQIPYKFYLSTPKDFEDALHLWEVTKNNLNMQELHKYAKDLKVERKVLEWLK